MVATGAERPRFLGQSGHRRRTCFGASMVSIASMFMSIAPIKILRAKIVSCGGGPLGSWPRANGTPMSTPTANAAAGGKPERQLIRAPAAPAREYWR